jgi:hypothetical protein
MLFVDLTLQTSGQGEDSKPAPVEEQRGSAPVPVGDRQGLSDGSADEPAAKKYRVI